MRQLRRASQVERLQVLRYDRRPAQFALDALTKGIACARFTDDRSRFIASALLYSLNESLDLGIGMQLYGGSDTSEYGRFENVYYASVQCFF